MTDQIERQAATSHASNRVSSSGLSIGEIEDCYLWSIQANRKQALPAFVLAVFGEAAEFGQMLDAVTIRLLQLWPRKAYLLCAQPELPAALQVFSSMATDISHGFCELSLEGAQALEFLGSHSSSDPMAAGIAETRNLRCLLGQYPVILWWDRPDDIRILIERSYAQSFCDYLEQLMQRWS